MSACTVPDCPALAVSGRRCQLHQYAQTVAQAHCVKKRCVACRRLFRKKDFVFREPVVKPTKSKAGDLYGWRHVACEPPSQRISRRKIRESEKPLLVDL